MVGHTTTNFDFDTVAETHKLKILLNNIATRVNEGTVLGGLCCHWWAPTRLWNPPFKTPKIAWFPAHVSLLTCLLFDRFIALFCKVLKQKLKATSFGCLTASCHLQVNSATFRWLFLIALGWIYHFVFGCNFRLRSGQLLKNANTSLETSWWCHNWCHNPKDFPYMGEGGADQVVWANQWIWQRQFGNSGAPSWAVWYCVLYRRKFMAQPLLGCCWGSPQIWQYLPQPDAEKVDWSGSTWFCWWPRACYAACLHPGFSNIIRWGQSNDANRRVDALLL